MGNLKTSPGCGCQSDLPSCPALSTQSACPHPGWVLMKLCCKETLVVCKMVAYHIQVVEICHQRNYGSDNIALVWSFQIFSVHGITLTHCGLVYGAKHLGQYWIMTLPIRKQPSWLNPLQTALVLSWMAETFSFYLGQCWQQSMIP